MRRRPNARVGRREKLRALGDFSCALPEALRFVRERVQSLTVAPERPRPGHLYACSLSQSGYDGRGYLFIVGLEEGRVFAGSTEDPVLLDEERARVSEDLKRSTDRIDEAVSATMRKEFNQFRRPKYLFSGLTKCAVCGGGYVILWGEKLACFNARSRGTCIIPHILRGDIQ